MGLRWVNSFPRHAKACLCKNIRIKTLRVHSLVKSTKAPLFVMVSVCKVAQCKAISVQKCACVCVKAFLCVKASLCKSISVYNYLCVRARAFKNIPAKARARMCAWKQRLRVRKTSPCSVKVFLCKKIPAGENLCVKKLVKTVCKSISVYNKMCKSNSVYRHPSVCV